MVCEMSMRQDLALGMRTPQRLSELVQKPAVLHGDQGMLYAHAVFRKRAAELRLKQSCSRKGNCWDNAVVEGWNGTFKTERLCRPNNRFHKNLLTAEEARKEILEYCRCCNDERIQARLNCRSPKQFWEAAIQEP